MSDATNERPPRRGRVVVIGWDGATYNLLRPWLTAGVLPNFQRLLDRGTSGDLLSVFPPISAPAWGSFLTGLEPANHGFLTWLTPVSVGGRKVTDARSIRAPRLHNYLARHHKKVGLFNVPSTYPPEDVDGFMVCGMLTPSLDTTFTHPADLYEKIIKPMGPYGIELAMGQYGQEEAARVSADMSTLTSLRWKASKRLWEMYDTDVLVVVFEGPDRMQHKLYQFMDETHPLHDAKKAATLRPPILEYYHHLDDILGDIMAQLGMDDTLLLISDHGFGPWDRRFSVNRWLADGSWLTLRDDKGEGESTLQALRDKVRLRTRLKWLMRRFSDQPVVVKARAQPHMKTNAAVAERIVWEQTKAYSSTLAEYGIYVNLQGRDEHGIVAPGQEYEQVVNQLVRDLAAMKDPDTGQNIMLRVGRREDIHPGPFMGEAPDVCFLPRSGYHQCNLLHRGQAVEVLKTRERHGPGGHQPEGIFAAMGPSIRQGATIQGAALVDIMPTMLHLAGTPVPRGLDGRVLSELFEPGTYDAREVVMEDPLRQEDLAGAFNTDEDEETVRERLKDLGYIN